MLTQERLSVYGEKKREYSHPTNHFDKAIKIAKDLDIDNTTLATILCMSEAIIFQHKNGDPVSTLSDKSHHLLLLLIDVHTYLNSISNGDISFERQWIKMENDYLGEAPILIMRFPNGLDKILEYLKNRSPSLNRVTL
ncbi:hypothetical protein [Kiloniella sp.]|uniref:hypothetical protein n=1 Tax=Kiloniella sp. TaxID=1938587 RepID=UPI003B010E62